MSKRSAARAKGKRFETEVRAWLEAGGFTCDQARASLKMIGPGRFISSSNDFFGCTDLIAVHPFYEKTVFIQCHAGDDPYSRMHKMDAVSWNTRAQQVLVFQRKRITDWRCYTKQGGAWRCILLLPREAESVAFLRGVGGS